MKRIISFVLLLVSFIVVLMQPAVEVPAVPAHPIPVWSILSYLTVVAMTGFAVFLMSREERMAEPEMA